MPKLTDEKRPIQARDNQWLTKRIGQLEAMIKTILSSSWGSGNVPITLTVPANRTATIYSVTGDVYFNRHLTITDIVTGNQLSAQVEIYVNGTNKNWFSEAIVGQIDGVSFTVNSPNLITELIVINGLNHSVEAELI